MLVEPLKRWLQKRRRNYKLATANYTSRVEASLEKETGEKLRKLKSTHQDDKIKHEQLQVLHRKKVVARALRKFNNLSCSLPIHKCILGKYNESLNTKYDKSRCVSINGSSAASLKGSQVLAVERSMKKRISLIEGVAGSGKTLIAANLATSMNRMRRRKILVCSPVQATVDRLAQMIAESGARVVRLTGDDRIGKLSRRLSEDHIRGELDCTLASLVNLEIYRRSRLRYENILDGVAKRNHLKHQQAIRMTRNSSLWLRRKVKDAILQRADIVCCTLVQAGDRCLDGITFDMLIIDDAQIASEVECLIPIALRGMKQVTMLGDIRREIRLQANNSLRRQSKANKSTLKPSAGNWNQQINEIGGLFERWIAMGLTTVALRTQFRMHPLIAMFPGHHFYLSRIETDKETSEQLNSQSHEIKALARRGFDWLTNPEYFTAVFDASGNETVGQVVGQLVNKLVLLEGIDCSRIGIITNRETTGEAILGVQVNNVREMLGQEREFIILWCEEDADAEFSSKNTELDCNFILNDNSLNAAITRARLGLFIVARLSEQHNEKQAAACKSWKNLLKFYQINNLIGVLK